MHIYIELLHYLSEITYALSKILSAKKTSGFLYDIK